MSMYFFIVLGRPLCVSVRPLMGSCLEFSVVSICALRDDVRSAHAKEGTRQIHLGNACEKPQSAKDVAD